MNKDCLLVIISYLDTKDVMILSLVSKRFNDLCKDEMIWKLLFEKDFSNIDCILLWYENYIKCFVLNKFLMKYRKNINTVKESLDLAYNLQSIPPEIGKLKMLQTLYLSYNKLQSIPPEIGQLKMLQKLSLYNNNLYSIPSEIIQLKILQYLFVDRNIIIPETINKGILIYK